MPWLGCLPSLYASMRARIQQLIIGVWLRYWIAAVRVSYWTYLPTFLSKSVKGEVNGCTTSSLLVQDWGCFQNCHCSARSLLDRIGITSPSDYFDSIESLARKLSATIGLKGEELLNSKPENPLLASIKSLEVDDLRRFQDLLYIVVQIAEPSTVLGLESRIRSITRNSGIAPTSLFLTDDVEVADRFPLYGGGFADVYRGLYGGRTVAVKALRMTTSMQEAQLSKLKRACYREALIWKRAHHMFVLPCLGITEKLFNGSICLVTPWMEMGTLKQYLQKNPNLDCIPLMKQIVVGLKHIHSLHFIHGDLKGDNVFMKNHNEICLGDLGLSITSASYAFLSSINFSGGGSTRWMAPELLVDNEPRASFASDVYALAMTIYESISRKEPYFEMSERRIVLAIINGQRPIRIDGIDASMWRLLEACWVSEQSSRPHLDDVASKLNDMRS